MVYKCRHIARIYIPCKRNRQQSDFLIFYFVISEISSSGIFVILEIISIDIPLSDIAFTIERICSFYSAIVLSFCIRAVSLFSIAEKNSSSIRYLNTESYKCYANIHIFSIKPKVSCVIILCPTGKTCAIRHVVVVIRSLNILIMNKELNLLIHAKTTKHSLSFASHSAYCRHAEILLRVIKESTTSVISLV